MGSYLSIKFIKNTTDHTQIKKALIQYFKWQCISTGSILYKNSKVLNLLIKSYLEFLKIRTPSQSNCFKKRMFTWTVQICATSLVPSCFCLFFFQVEMEYSASLWASSPSPTNSTSQRFYLQLELCEDRFHGIEETTTFLSSSHKEVCSGSHIGKALAG